MPFLCTPHWLTPADYRVSRGRTDWYAFEWHQAFTVVAGRTTIMQEIPFGGYQLVVTFTDDFWNWNHKEFRFAGIFEDVYAIAPGGGPPIDAGDVYFYCKRASPFFLDSVFITTAAPGNRYYFFELPPRDRPYWNATIAPQPLPPFPYIPP